MLSPRDERSGTLPQGRYLREDETVQVGAPEQVMRDLLNTMFTVRTYILLGIGILGLAALAMLTMVFVLSLQLRRREIETMTKIGGTWWRIVSVLGLEIAGVLVSGMATAGLPAACTYRFAAAVTRALILIR